LTNTKGVPVTVTDETRSAHRERQFHSARDFETSASQIGEVTPFAEEVKAKAQRIIAANAKGRSRKAQVADATELMRMLGVHPDDVFDPTGLDAPLPRPNNNNSARR
jgi:hypothetical protein